jgi:uncharacterized protein involved in exopolysaccharide biosynthesis
MYLQGRLFISIQLLPRVEAPMIRYLETLFHHHRLLLSPVVVVAVVAFGLVLTQPRTYTATAKLWTDAPAYGPNSGFANTSTNPADAQAAVLEELLKTRAFAVKAGKRGPLAAYLSQSHPATDPVGKLLGAVGGRSSGGLQGAALDDAVASAIANSTKVDAPGPDVVTVSFKFADPSAAAGTVQAIVDQFLDEMLYNSRATAAGAVAFYSEQVKASEADLKAADARVDAYLAAHPEQKALNPPPDANLDQLKRDDDLLRQRYEGLLQKLDQANLNQAALQDPSSIGLRIIDPPIKPSRPDSRNSLLLQAAAGSAAVGLVILLFGVLGLTIADATVRRSSEVETLLGLRLAASVPLLARVGDA